MLKKSTPKPQEIKMSRENSVKLSVPTIVIFSIIIAIASAYIKDRISTTADSTKVNTQQVQFSTDLSSMRTQIDDIRRNYIPRSEEETQFRYLQSAIDDLRGDMKELKRWAIEKQDKIK